MLIERPVHQGENGMLLRIPGRAPIPLTSGDKPVRVFNPGWHAESLFTLLDPLWLLVLRHDSGEAACWHIDSEGRMAAPPAHRPQQERIRSIARMRQLALWLGMARDTPIRLPMPDAVEAYLRLPAVVRHGLETLLGAPLPGPLPQQMGREDALPLAFERIPGTNGYRIGHPGALVPLGTGGVPTELLEGWQVEGIETSFAPLLTIVLRHDEGARAAWFADLHGQMVGNHLSHLSPALQDRVLQGAGVLFEEMWDQVVLGLDGRRRTAAQAVIGSVPLADLGSLAPVWMSAAGRGGDTRIWALDEALPPGMGFLVPTGQGLRGLEPELAARALFHSFYAEADRLLRTGRMQWPSPVDGMLVESDGFALLIDKDCFAFRFRQDATGLVFCVICSGGHFRNYALYFPAAELLVMQTRAPGGDFVRIDRMGETLLRHLSQFDGALSEGRNIPADPTVQVVYGACAIHIGHYIWQDLSGLAIMLRQNLPTDRLPRLQMFELGRTQQFFGPEERIFPELDGRIARHAGRFAAHVDAFYRRNQRVIKYTSISVPAALRCSVLTAAETDPALQAARHEADAARERAAVILLGIRVGNRTMVDLDDFAAALVRHLGTVFPGCTVVLDGLNDVRDRGGAEDAPAGSDLAQELALARALAVVADEAGIRFVDNINRSALRSVLWCSRADAFIAPLGAALAKYRWICNTPGMVLSSRWNIENRDDLHIYDSPAALEGSSEMHFNAVADVQDAEAAPEPARTNFVIARTPVFAQFDDLVRRTLTARAVTQA
jgi:hypothetical protein